MVTIRPTRFNVHKLYLPPMDFISIICLDVKTNNFFIIQHSVAGLFFRVGMGVNPLGTEGLNVMLINFYLQTINLAFFFVIYILVQD